MGLPAEVVYDNRLGKVAFDHDQHILDAKGDCSACHDSLFDWRKSPLDYADDYHRTAEANKSSCAGCHVEQGGSFASIENCDRCHQNLELDRRGG
jgi:c(7)-type cytochrome triheme protein